jgi:RHS repeat-associated protein
MIWGHEPSQGWGLLEERGPNGELLARHVHGPSIDDLVLSELNGAVYYYHQDHLNSTVAVTDENGNVVEQYRYDVYGQPYFYGPDSTPRAESALGLRFLFTGREWLSSLALYDYRHRAYSPSLGRFVQLDPLGFASGDVNVYWYVGNICVSLTDPFGLLPPWYARPSTICAGIGVALTFVAAASTSPVWGPLAGGFGVVSLVLVGFEATDEYVERRQREWERELEKIQREELEKELEQKREELKKTRQILSAQVELQSCPAVGR